MPDKEMLLRIKKKLPHGSLQKIADKLELSHQTVRNAFDNKAKIHLPDVIKEAAIILKEEKERIKRLNETLETID